jgi:hypothetical protein
MRTRIDQLAHSARLAGRFLAFPFASLLLLSCSTEAGTVLQFSQVSSTDVVVATNNGIGTTTFSTTSPINTDGGGVSIPVNISNYLGMTQVPFPLLAFETVSVTSTDVASPGGTITQAYSGTIEFTANPVNDPSGAGQVFLLATFGSGAFSGGTNGGSASLNASVPQNVVTFTVPGLSFADAALSISFSGIVPPLGITAGSVSSFAGQNSGTFSANGVPEPGTLCLASFAIVIGTLAHGRKKMKNAG